MKTWISVAAAAALTVVAAACSDSTPPTAPGPAPVPAVAAPSLESPTADQQLSTLRPTLTVRNATSDQAGTRTYEFQISDSTNFTASTTSQILGFAATISGAAVPEGPSGITSWTPPSDLQPTTRFYWRARAIQGTTTGPWSSTGTFRSKLVGFNRPGELYDPLIHGETVGDRIGSTTFIPGRGLQLNDGQSHVRYLLPQTITSGEFSMDVEGLRANGPGDKAKVFGMQEGQTDFITNRYRIDIQYRGSAGFPPNAIQWRVIYGDADDLDVRYEPDTERRFASVIALNPATPYHWKFTWGSAVRLVLREGGINGRSLYDYGLPATKGSYAPSPHYAYLGAPVGRSGNESASIAGTIYRNVWLANRPRPASLGSALR
ncbi:MAG: hypothetical protein M3R55_00115 [Acidobacteriota bacterium]|nr:hypothetical protein [Acidobacteriota bacterium]